MKKWFVFLLLSVFSVTLIGCDFIEEQIQREMERIESIEFVDIRADIGNRSIQLNITSNVDEQLIEAITINGVRYDLVSQGDDWYLLEDIPITHEYTITSVSYRSGLGPLVPFNINQTFTLREAIDALSSEFLHTVETAPLVFENYTFEQSEETLISITTERDYVVEELDDWVWLILENDVPIYAVVDYDDVLYVILVPEEVEEFLE